MFEHNAIPNMIAGANYNLFTFIFNVFMMVFVVSQVRGGPGHFQVLGTVIMITLTPSHHAQVGP